MVPWTKAGQRSRDAVGDSLMHRGWDLGQGSAMQGLKGASAPSPGVHRLTPDYASGAAGPSSLSSLCLGSLWL